MVWTGNNIFRNASQGMGLNEGIYGPLLDALTSQTNDPYGKPIPSSYVPPTALTGDVATYGGYGGGTNPTAPTTPPMTGGTTGGGGATGGGVNSPPPAGGSRDNGDGRQGGSAEPGAGAGGGYAADGGSGSLSDALAGIFGGSNQNVFQFDPVAQEYGIYGTLASILTGIPGFGLAGSSYGNYLDEQQAQNLYDGFTYGYDFEDPNYSTLSGILNTMTAGLAGTSMNDQLAESVGLMSDRDIAEALGVSDSLTGQGSVDVSYANEGPYSNLQTETLSFGDTTNSLDAQIADLQSQLGYYDSDSAQYNQISRQIKELEAQASGGDRYSQSTMDMLGNIADNARDSSTAVGADRERDQSQPGSDASRQSGPR